MRVWLMTVGEPLPTDPGHQRLHRSGIMANVLATRGIDVVWWTSAFRHSDKTFRVNETTWSNVGDHLRICCLASRAYHRNVSLARILANRDIAREFTRHCRDEPPPDVIVASYPIPELARAGARYAHAHGIPAIVDVRDLWPDIWIPALPRVLRPFGPIGALPFFLQARRTLQAFDGVCGITDEIVDWGLARAARKRGPWDRAFPLAYAEADYPETALAEAKEFWRATLVGRAPTRLRLCFFGSMPIARTRTDVMVEAMRRLPSDVADGTQLVLCGTGEDFERIQALAADLPRIIMPGWVSGPQIATLAAQSHAGLLPYPSAQDFSRSIPNKAIEYLAHGLPIVTSLRGPLSDLIESERCGLLYRETDASDLSEKIVSLYRTPEHLIELSHNAVSTFRKHFTAAQVYDRLTDMLVKLAETQRA